MIQENNMDELTLNNMKDVTGGAQSAGLTEVPYPMLKMKATECKRAGKTLDETVVAVMNYFGLPSDMITEVRSYITSIWSSI